MRPHQTYAALGADYLTVEGVYSEAELWSIDDPPFTVPVRSAFDAHSFEPQVVEITPRRFELIQFVGACRCGQMLYTMPRCEADGQLFLGDAAARNVTGDDCPKELIYPDASVPSCGPCRRKRSHMQQCLDALKNLSAKLHAREDAGG